MTTRFSVELSETTFELSSREDELMLIVTCLLRLTAVISDWAILVSEPRCSHTEIELPI